MIVSNVVNKQVLKERQREVLEFLSECLIPSFGPMGSNTTISLENQLTKYTKDGKTILEKIQVMGDIESVIKDDIWEICQQVVKKVGDGTTSAILLSYYIFTELCELVDNQDKKYHNMAPSLIVEEFKNAVESITQRIRSRKRELDLDAVYDISYISTNGNKQFANHIRNIYEKFGNEVFIDVSPSFNGESFDKEYDGLTLENGFLDPAFINAAGNKFVINNPRIYAFLDPINTNEQINFLDAIIEKNIMMPASGQYAEYSEMYPTIILCKGMSRDMSAYVDTIISKMSKMNRMEKLPICIVSNIHQQDQYNDIIKLAGCKPIQKFMDPEIQRQQIELGNAPTLGNIEEFYGTCQLIEIDAYKTKFINPIHMKDENGEYTQIFNEMLNTLEAQLKLAIDQSESINVIGTLKRRIQSLKANLVEYHVGGITVADRDAAKDLIEDAVLNVRSASVNGYGLAGNTEALNASYQLMMEDVNDSDNEMFRVIYKAYKSLITTLHKNSGIDQNESNAIITSLSDRDIKNTFDVRNKCFSDKVITSIETDCVVLDGISKIVTLLFTSNQFLCKSPSFNQYI